MKRRVKRPRKQERGRGGSWDLGDEVECIVLDVDRNISGDWDPSHSVEQDLADGRAIQVISSEDSHIVAERGVSVDPIEFLLLIMDRETHRMNKRR
jgi:hypothetical protein